jgi:hypothetical protein
VTVFGGRYYTLTKQICLCGWPAKGGAGGRLVLAFLIESEPLAVDPEKTFGGFPVLTFAAHPLPEDA